MPNLVEFHPGHERRVDDKYLIPGGRDVKSSIRANRLVRIAISLDCGQLSGDWRGY